MREIIHIKNGKMEIYLAEFIKKILIRITKEFVYSTEKNSKNEIALAQSVQGLQTFRSLAQIIHRTKSLYVCMLFIQ
jgi:hypothetical protein